MDHEMKVFGRHALSVMGGSGDTRLIWNTRDSDECRAAQRTFEDLTGKGFRAYTVGTRGETDRPITTFDPEAEKIILTPPMSGGAGVLTTLEQAREALRTLTDPSEDYYYSDWSECTCGHVYKAATGGKTFAAPLAHGMDWDKAEPLFAAIVRANDLPMNKRPVDYRLGVRLAVAVSEATYDRAMEDHNVPNATHEYDDAYRQEAIKLLQATVAMLEAEQEQARLDVLAQARGVVEAVDMSEVPTVHATAEDYAEAYAEAMVR